MNSTVILVDKQQLSEYITTGKIPTHWVGYDGSSIYSDTLIEYVITKEKLMSWRNPTNEQVLGPKILLKG